MALLNTTIIRGDLTVNGKLRTNGNALSTTVITGSTTSTLTTGSTYLQLFNHNAAIIINLPLVPYDEESFVFKDASGNALTNNVIVSGSTKNIDGSSTALINTDYGAFQLVYNSTLNAWYSTNLIS